MIDERKGFTSASSAGADLLCPGRHLAQQGLPDVPSEDALSGTRIHAWLAGKEVELTVDEMEVAQACKWIKTSIVEDWIEEDAWREFMEERLWCAVGLVEHSGQPDVVYVQGKRALILDYKTGRNEVPEPNTNQQLRDLAVLATIRWPEVDEVTVSIVQPFAMRQPPCVYDEKDLQRAKQDMRNRIRQSNNPISPRIAGDKQCRYCRAKTICREYSEWTKGALPLVAASNLDIQQPWTPEQWAKFLTIATEAEAWIENRRAEARQMLKSNPESIPGFTLSKGNTKEKITDAQAVFDQATMRGVSQSDFMAAVTITKKGLKEALSKTGLKGAELESAMDEILFGNTVQQEVEPRIIRKLST